MNMRQSETSIIFLQHASEIIANTDNGLTGSDIVKKCNSYTFKFPVKIAHMHSPL